MNQITTLTRSIITSHFPELDDIKIPANYHRLKNGKEKCCLIYGTQGENYYIEADTSLKNLQE